MTRREDKLAALIERASDSRNLLVRFDLEAAAVNSLPAALDIIRAARLVSGPITVRQLDALCAALAAWDGKEGSDA